MSRFQRGRRTLREQRIASNSAQSFYAAMLPADDPRRAEHLERLERERAAVKPKRVVKPSGKPLEAPVIAAISELLAVHPRVLIALRMNSGSLTYTAANGKQVPVWMHKWLRSPEKMRMSDFFGILNCNYVENTLDYRTFAIEAKAPGWTKPTNEREEEQAAFLDLITRHGGRAGFATSVEEARAIIEGA